MCKIEKIKCINNLLIMDSFINLFELCLNEHTTHVKKGIETSVKKKLDMKNNDLTEIPCKIADDIVNLDLSKNHIMEIPMGSIKPSITMLDLSYNKFSKIPENTNNINTLILNYNKITEIDGKKISPLIKTLVLSQNRINRIRNLYHGVYIELMYNPCYRITYQLSMREMIWMSNFSLINKCFLDNDILSIITKYCVYVIFI